MDMKKNKWMMSVLLLPLTLQAQTLEECQQAAEHNYPLIRQYGLIEKTTQLTVDNISKAWLPQLTASAQATLQSSVAAWPDPMQAMLSELGVRVEGLKKDQYRIGIDVQQTLYDGGTISSQKAIARQQGAVQAAQNEEHLYHVRQRVNDIYFALLLTDQQLKLNADLQQLLSANEKKLLSMYEKGTAAESDYLNVKAERLNALQQHTSLQTQRQTLSRLLAALSGLEVNTLTKPLPTLTCRQAGVRPELKTIDAQVKLVEEEEKALDAALMPKVGLFAQGWYGYPGLNMFGDMMHRQFSWNGLIGVKLTWNIGALYSRKNDKEKLNMQRETFNVQRDMFLFNNNLEQIQQNEDIARYRKLMDEDEAVIRLRSSIRRAAESKLAHGIIDVNDLVREINAENAARIQQTVHEIKMLKEIYDLKITTNQ